MNKVEDCIAHLRNRVNAKLMKNTYKQLAVFCHVGETLLYRFAHGGHIGTEYLILIERALDSIECMEDSHVE
jgi:hypothetical protein